MVYSLCWAWGDGGLGSGRAAGSRAQGVSLTFVKVEAARDIDNSGDIIILGSVCEDRVASLAVTCTTQAKRVKRVLTWLFRSATLKICKDRHQ